MYVLIALLAAFSMNVAYALPEHFVYLHEVDPSIYQDIRYAGWHNFIGRPVAGYKARQCILTIEAARALSHVQDELKLHHLSLKVYDCYRPVRAVQNFISWSRDIDDQKMKEEFYPNIDKKDVFRLGYVAKRSAHSRGSTVDLTIVSTRDRAQSAEGQDVNCTAPFTKRAHEDINMGTNYDCLDVLSHPLNMQVSQLAFEHRMLLRKLMEKYGFKPLSTEWWHFTLVNEPYPYQERNFPVE